MALFTPDDIAQLREVAMLPFQDEYVLTRKNPTPTRDVMGNNKGASVSSYALVESGLGRLRREGLQPMERVWADRMGWTSTYSIDLPLDTLATPEDRLSIDNRDFEIEGVMREGFMALIATAVCHERSH